MSRSLRVCLYSPADLNIVSGASIWVQAVAETLHSGSDNHIVLPLRTVERRPLLTDPLRRLSRVEIVDPRRLRPFVAAEGLDSDAALDLIELLDRESRFDVIILRSFEAALAAMDRPGLRGRLWSTYVLEPERDMASPTYLSDLTRIAMGSRYIVTQSEEMRALVETIVPATRGKTIILPPGVPTSGVRRPIPEPRRRLWYAGKYHPFYPVPMMLDLFESLRSDHPLLEFHAVGDQVFRAPRDGGWADDLERRLVTTPGVTWHGAMARDDAIRLLGGGGIALSLWDYRHGDRMNDLVVSTKLLDYCVAGLPVVLNRTAAQESILGADYPLFVDDLEEVLAVLRQVLDEPSLAREAADRCRAAVSRFTYPAVYESIAPFLEGRPTAALRQFDRPKLPGAEHNLGLLLDADTVALPPWVARIAELLGTDDPADRVRLVIGVRARPGATDPEPGADPASELLGGLSPLVRRSVSARTVVDEPSWWRTIGMFLADPAMDPARAAPGLASGAVLIPCQSDLHGAHAVLTRIKALLDPTSWSAASTDARASAYEVRAEVADSPKDGG